MLERKTPRACSSATAPATRRSFDYAVRTVKSTLVEKIPTFGICLGHQVLGQVFGAKTFKMKFGHHGGNQPVMDLTTEKVEITSQNHSFAVDPDAAPGRCAGDAHQPERRDGRRDSQHAELAGVLGAVPPGGGTWAA